MAREQNRSAIDPDDLLDRPMGEITAADFLKVLGAPSVGKLGSAMLADKKKFELWVEEVDMPKISVRELLDKMRQEKKKYELELEPTPVPGPTPVVDWRNEKKKLELELDPPIPRAEPVFDWRSEKKKVEYEFPDFYGRRSSQYEQSGFNADYNRLVEEIAVRVEERLGRRR